MAYRVTANICLVVDDDQAQDEEQAKLAAIEQLGDFFAHHQWLELFQVEKIEEGGEA